MREPKPAAVNKLLHLRANGWRETTEDMSHLKVLRGNFVRQLFSCAKNGKGSQTNSQVRVLRNLATQTEPSVDNKFLTSPWGEIQVGNETLTEHVFKDVEKWSDEPSVVSVCIYYVITY